MPKFGSKRQPSMYAYIRVSIDSSLYKPTISIPIMPSFICLNLGRKGCPSVYAHIMVLIMLISKCPYLCLKTCPLSMSKSGPVNMLLYLHQHQGFQNDFLYTHIWISEANPSVYGPVRVSNNASVYFRIMLPKMPLCICPNFCL